MLPVTELRRQLADSDTGGTRWERGEEAARRAQEFAAEAQTHASVWFDKSRVLLEEQTQRLLTAFEAGKEAMREEIRKWSPASPPQ